MALDQEHEYAFREREVKALEKIAEAAQLLIDDHRERQERLEGFDEEERQAPPSSATSEPPQGGSYAAPATAGDAPPPPAAPAPGATG